MENVDKILLEYSQLAGKDDAKSESRKEEILALVEKQATDDDRQIAQKFIEDKLEEVEKSVKLLRQSISEEDYKLLPLSYIAKTYFGKSASWLLQRINGYQVRGKVYTLNEEQKGVFNRAVQDISKRLGALQLA